MKITYTKLITIRELRRRFTYHKGGFLIRKIRTCPRTYIGQKVFGFPSSGKKNQETSYLVIAVGSRYMPIHAAIFAIVKGRWPKNILDHRDRNRFNNRIGNLREASYSQNRINTALNLKNKSGYRGVHWAKGKWVVTLSTCNKRQYLGRFRNLKDAVVIQKKFITKHHKEFRAT